MTTWTKIENKHAPKRRETPAVQVRADRALLALPASMVSARRVDVLLDPENRIGIRFNPRGAFAVQRMGERKRNTRHISVPKALLGDLCCGTHEISVQREGDVLVLAV